jgi:hypothetical protein
MKGTTAEGRTPPTDEHLIPFARLGTGAPHASRVAVLGLDTAQTEDIRRGVQQALSELVHDLSFVYHRTAEVLDAELGARSQPDGMGTNWDRRAEGLGELSQASDMLAATPLLRDFAEACLAIIVLDRFSESENDSVANPWAYPLARPASSAERTATSLLAFVAELERLHVPVLLVGDSHHDATQTRFIEQALAVGADEVVDWYECTSAARLAKRVQSALLSQHVTLEAFRLWCAAGRAAGQVRLPSATEPSTYLPRRSAGDAEVDGHHEVRAEAERRAGERRAADRRAGAWALVPPYLPVARILTCESGAVTAGDVLWRNLVGGLRVTLHGLRLNGRVALRTEDSTWARTGGCRVELPAQAFVARTRVVYTKVDATWAQEPGLPTSSEGRSEAAAAPPRAEEPDWMATEPRARMLPSERPISDAERVRARARLHAAVATLPTSAARAASPVAPILELLTPQLRAPSGRLDARKVAERLGVSLRAFARALGTSHQALSATPDAPRIQGALDAYARVLGTLDTALHHDDAVRAWLYTPRRELEGRTPQEALLAGDALTVAQLLVPLHTGAVG